MGLVPAGLVRLDCRIPSPLIYISLKKNKTIVIYLVLQSTPTHVNKWAGYSAIVPLVPSCELAIFATKSSRRDQNLVPATGPTNSNWFEFVARIMYMYMF